MPAKLTEGRRASHAHGLVSHGARLGGVRARALVQASGLAQPPALASPLLDPSMAVWMPGDLRQFHSRGSAAWAFDFDGNLRQYAAGELRIVPSPVGLPAALREVGSTNKHANFNANPVDLTGMGFTNATNGLATFGLVDDSAALSASGLSRVCSSGLVYKLDNTLGDTTARVDFNAGATGNTNVHSYSCYTRGSVGAATVFTGTDVAWNAIPLAGATYARTIGANRVPASVNTRLRLNVFPGDVVYFILNQLEELAYATTPIVVAGAAVARGFDDITIPVAIENGRPFSMLMDCVVMDGTAATLGGTASTFAGAQRTIGLTGGTLNASNNVSQLNAAPAYVPGTRARAAYAQDHGGRALVYNAGAVAAQQGGQTITGEARRVTLGARQVGSDVEGSVAYIHEFRTWSRRLSNDVLQMLTVREGR